MTWKKILPATFAAALLVTAGAAGANEGKEMKSGEQMGQLGQDQQEVTLTVTSVDQASNKVQFEANLDPTAQIQKGEETITVNDLQPGDNVRASFDPMTGEVQSLEVIEGGQQQQEPGMQPGAQPPSSTDPSLEEPTMPESGY